MNPMRCDMSESNEQYELKFDGATIVGSLYSHYDVSERGQDEMQVILSNGVVIDVGWHPENRPESKLFVRVICGGNWEKPEEIYSIDEPAKALGLVIGLESKYRSHQQKPNQPNQYAKPFPGGGSHDVYDVLTAFGVTCPAVAHAVKKLLCAGQRGHKDRLTDLREAMTAIARAAELERSGS